MFAVLLEGPFKPQWACERFSVFTLDAQDEDTRKSRAGYLLWISAFSQEEKMYATESVTIANAYN